MPAALNLSNEVVKMRSEVKRVKVLILRKLTRQVATLKMKKGTEADLERNRRRAERLLEEVRLLKALAPDVVTKTALQSDISFEKVCQNKDASLTERATARVAAHPDFSKKIQSIKSAVAAFKAERTGSAEKKSVKESRDEDQEESDADPDSDEEESEDEESETEQIHTAEKQEPSEITEQIEEAPSTAEEKSSDSAPPEVSRMRKEVKKLRILIIRKLTQEITGLKRTTSEGPEHEGNRECVARLQREVHVLRGLQPDFVTRRALEGSADLEKVLQDPESSPEERAAARIATNPRFVKKLLDVRVAIEEEKAKAAKAEERNRTKQEESRMIKAEAGDDDEGKTDFNDDADNGSDNADERKPKDPTPKSRSAETKCAVKSPDGPKSSEKPEVKPSNPSKTKESAPAPKQAAEPATKKTEDPDEEEDSDLSDSEGEQEKEYFDDSTEERFHKQSSHSEQSDDDFFLGKVSKFKKKRSSSSAPSKEKNDPEEPAEAEDTSRSSQGSRFRMESVFCQALSGSNSSQKGKPAGPKPPRFQNQKRADGKPSWFKSQDSGTDKRQFRDRGFKEQGPRRSGPSGERRGQQSKPAFDRQSNKPGRPSQQALHPSWEASRKRKEQQAQITAFQGKKIKFDLDD